MKIGITLPQVGSMANKENVKNIARIAEDEKLDSLWVFERLLWPINPQTPYPATKDGKLPEENKIIFDPLQTLSFVSAITSKVKLGTCIIDMLFHNPVVLSRNFATLDVLSDGRAIAGFGIGWSKDEYQASNIPFTSKGKRADEYLQLIKRIWQDDIVEFKGAYYTIPSSNIGPKPIQKPNIPIYLGGFSSNTFLRIVTHDTNGWLGTFGGPIEQIEETIKIIKQIAKNVNKNPANFKVILLAFPNIVEKNNENLHSNQKYPMIGTVDQIGNNIKTIKDIVDHIIFGYNFSPLGKDIDKMIDITKQLSKFAN